jgi:O-antigen ligase
VAVGAAAGLLVFAFLWAHPSKLVDKFSHMGHDASTYGRLQVWSDAWHIFRDFPMTGTGMGTFADVMIVYQSGSRAATYTQAHNDYLQVLAEGGVVVAAAALALLVAIATGAAYRLRRDADPVTNWIRYGAVAGLLGIGVQSMVEFSLQMPGVAALFVVVTAVALHRPPDRVPHAHRM